MCIRKNKSLKYHNLWSLTFKRTKFNTKSEGELFTFVLWLPLCKIPFRIRSILFTIFWWAKSVMFSSSTWRSIYPCMSFILWKRFLENKFTVIKQMLPFCFIISLDNFISKEISISKYKYILRRLEDTKVPGKCWKQPKIPSSRNWLLSIQRTVTQPLSCHSKDLSALP